MPRSRLGSRLGLRLAGLVAAVACLAGMTVAAGSPASGAPVAAAARQAPATARPPPATARPASATLLPAHVFAPYYFNTSDTLAATSRARPGDT